MIEWEEVRKTVLDSSRFVIIPPMPDLCNAETRWILIDYYELSKTKHPTLQAAKDFAETLVKEEEA